MKIRRFGSALVCAALALAGAGALPIAANAEEAAKAAPIGIGSATVQVLHSVTKEPLAGMPVRLRAITADDDGKRPAFWMAVTDRSGNATFASIPAGAYEASVDYNNQYTSVRFLLQNRDHKSVRLYFNPDIDK